MRQASKYLADRASLDAEHVGQLHFPELGAGRQPVIQHRLFDLAQDLVLAETRLPVIIDLRRHGIPVSLDVSQCNTLKNC